MHKGCEYCEGRAYTKKPLTVITKYGRKIELVFEFCPNCGRKMASERSIRRVAMDEQIKVKLFAKGYRKASDVINEVEQFIFMKYGEYFDFSELKKKYTEDCDG